MDLLRSLIQELENGKESAYQMRSLIQQLQGSDGGAQLDHPDHDHQCYYQGFNDHSMVVLAAFDNVLSRLQRCDLLNETAKVEYNGNSKSTPIGCKSKEELTSKSYTPKNTRGCYKRRKVGESATVIIVPNLTEDGYAWRKYGQKYILNNKYPRNYYRCTHKFEQGCQATKQVQQISEKPDQYRVTYQDKHTCKTLVTKTPPTISHDNPNYSFTLTSSNPLIFSSSPSSSASPSAMAKQECYIPNKDGNQSGPSDLHQSSDLTSTSTTACEQGDVISSSVDVGYHGMDNEECSGMDNEECRNMMDDLSVFDDVMMQDILCV